jgi:TonB family protein
LQLSPISYSFIIMKISRLVLLLLLGCVVTSRAQQPETLPPNFAGDDPATLLRQLVDLRKRLLKSEFETTPAYEARIIEEKKKPILDDRTVDDPFQLVAHAIKADYDADTQTMTFTLPVQTINRPQELRSVDKKITTDLSRAAMYRVLLGGEDDSHVLFNSAVGLAGSWDNQKFSVTAKLEVEAAKRLKTGAKAALFVHFEEPYATSEYVAGGQFLTRVAGIRFFDPQTGRILGGSGSAETAAQIRQAQALAAPDPDYASYNKNPSFKRIRIIDKPDAGYTEEARRNKVKGRVLLRVLFGENGQVTRISVVNGLPNGLTERAIAAARLIKFEPAELDGKKVAYPLMVVYVFRPH